MSVSVRHVHRSGLVAVTVLWNTSGMDGSQVMVKFKMGEKLTVLMCFDVLQGILL